MRSIDAEWVIAGVATLKECYEKTDIDPLALKHVWTALEMVERLLKEAPTIIPTIKVESVRHGRWVANQMTYPRSDKIYIETVCSKCGKDVNIEEFNLREWNEYKSKRYEIKASDYCPYCGAKMDEEAE